MRRIFAVAALPTLAFALSLAGCSQKKQAPASAPQYAAPAETSAAAPADTARAAVAGKTMYTCTMHPDYVTDKPGSCPKCGMVLVAKK